MNTSSIQVHTILQNSEEVKNLANNIIQNVYNTEIDKSLVGQGN